MKISSNIIICYHSSHQPRSRPLLSSYLSSYAVCSLPAATPKGRRFHDNRTTPSPSLASCTRILQGTRSARSPIHPLIEHEAVALRYNLEHPPPVVGRKQIPRCTTGARKAVKAVQYMHALMSTIGLSVASCLSKVGPAGLTIAVLFGPSPEAATECHMLRISGALHESCNSAPRVLLRSSALLLRTAGLAPLADTGKSGASCASGARQGWSTPARARTDPPKEAVTVASRRAGSSPMSVDSEAREAPRSGMYKAMAEGGDHDGLSHGDDEIVASWRAWLPKSMASNPRKFAVALRRKIAAGIQQGVLWYGKKVPKVKLQTSRRGTGTLDGMPLQKYKKQQKRRLPRVGWGMRARRDTSQVSMQAVELMQGSNAGEAPRGRTSDAIPSDSYDSDHADRVPTTVLRRAGTGFRGSIALPAVRATRGSTHALETDGMYDYLQRAGPRGLGGCTVLIGVQPAVHEDADRSMAALSDSLLACKYDVRRSAGTAQGRPGWVAAGECSPLRSLGTGAAGRGRGRSSRGCVRKWHGTAVQKGRSTGKKAWKRLRGHVTSDAPVPQSGGSFGMGRRILASAATGRPDGACGVASAVGLTSVDAPRLSSHHHVRRCEGHGEGGTVRGHGGGAAGEVQQSGAVSGPVPNGGEWWYHLPCGRRIARASMLHVTMGLDVKGASGRAGGGECPAEPGLPGGYDTALADAARQVPPLVWAELMPRVDGFRLTKRDVIALESALRGLQYRAKET